MRSQASFYQGVTLKKKDYPGCQVGDKERKAKGIKPWWSPRKAKRTPPEKPLRGSGVQRPVASQGRGVGSQLGPSKVPGRAPGAGVL